MLPVGRDGPVHVRRARRARPPPGCGPPALRRSPCRARRPGRTPPHRRHRAHRGGWTVSRTSSSKLSYGGRTVRRIRRPAASAPTCRTGPVPTSTRPGGSSDSGTACSAATSGAWLRIITPPAPSRIRRVRVAASPTSVSGELDATSGAEVVLGEPQPVAAELLEVARPAPGSRRACPATDPPAHTGAESSTPNRTEKG